MKLGLLLLLLSCFAANAQTPDSLEGKVLIRGTIANERTKEVLPSVRVVATVLDKYATREYQSLTNNLGEYSIYIDTTYVNELRFFKDRYIIEMYKFDKGFKDINRYFDRYAYDGVRSHGCGVPPIKFDKKSGKMSEDCYYTIEGIKTTMKNNPTIVMEFRGHTDSKGSFKNNEKLSLKWANEIVEMMVRGGIERDRFVVKGMGEYELLNKCKDGVRCKDEEYAINNRVDFKVIRNDYISKEKK
jgi:hypothetical protein